MTENQKSKLHATLYYLIMAMLTDVPTDRKMYANQALKALEDAKL